MYYRGNITLGFVVILKQTLTFWRNVSSLLVVDSESCKIDYINIVKTITFVSSKVETYPGTPPASMLLASVTSFDHTSNCHFLNPSTPQCTRPVWTPTRMFSTSTPVTLRTKLQYKAVHILLRYQIVLQHQIVNHEVAVILLVNNANDFIYEIVTYCADINFHKKLRICHMNGFCVDFMVDS